MSSKKAQLRRIAFFAILLGLSIPSAFARQIHETLLVQYAPSPSQISAWNDLAGPHSFRVELGSADSSTIEPLTGLRNWDRLQIESKNYPSSPEQTVWGKLAAMGAEYVSLSGDLPIDDEANRLNQAGFSHCLLVLDNYFGADPLAVLKKLKCQVELTYNVTAYPKTEEKQDLLTIPAGIPLLFYTDYWPFFVHMDVFNMLPHRIRLRVRDMFPPPDELDYLHHIQRLDSVSVEAQMEVSTDVWRSLGAQPVSWLVTDVVPSEKGLADFAASGPNRTIVIDDESPLTDAERSRLEAAAVDVEWIHSAPDSRYSPYSNY